MNSRLEKTTWLWLVDSVQDLGQSHVAWSFQARMEEDHHVPLTWGVQ